MPEYAGTYLVPASLLPNELAQDTPGGGEGGEGGDQNQPQPPPSLTPSRLSVCPCLITQPEGAASCTLRRQGNRPRLPQLQLLSPLGDQRDKNRAHWSSDDKSDFNTNAHLRQLAQ